MAQKLLVIYSLFALLSRHVIAPTPLMTGCMIIIAGPQRADAV
jgi:hypothetical protein